jgi:hypothetical protein
MSIDPWRQHAAGAAPSRAEDQKRAEEIYRRYQAVLAAREQPILGGPLVRYNHAPGALSAGQRYATRRHLAGRNEGAAPVGGALGSAVFSRAQLLGGPKRYTDPLLERSSTLTRLVGEPTPSTVLARPPTVIRMAV